MDKNEETTEELCTTYRRQIVEMVSELENLQIIRLIYGFVKSGFKEEVAGRE